MIATPLHHFVGIDPGQTGAIAVIDVMGTLVNWEKFDGTDPLKILDLLLTRPPSEMCIALEEVHAAPGQGVTSMFTFGRGLGQIEGFLKAGWHEYLLVSPQRWQAWLPCAGLEAGPKERIAKWVIERHGATTFIKKGCRVPHQGAMDAVAIAEYARRLHLGLVKRRVPGSKKKKMNTLKL